MKLDRVRRTLRDLAISHGLTDVDLKAYNEVTDNFDWNIDWKQDLTNSFDKRMGRLEAAFDLYDAATTANDRLTAKAALIDAGATLHSLTSFFDGMMHDVKKACSEPRFDWPSFPDGNWKIPPEYAFKE